VTRDEQVALLRKAAKIVEDDAGPLGMDISDQVMHGNLVTAAMFMESHDVPLDIDPLLVAAQRIIDAHGENR